MPDLLAQLQEIGFSQYEARAYLGLLQHSPVTGYELSKRSGIPRSMIYETLGKLLERGAAYTVPSDPTTYAPVPGAELIDRLRRAAEDTFGLLQVRLGAIERVPDLEVIHHVRGEERILAEMAAVIDRASDELWLGLWSAQVPVLEAAVQRAQQRGVVVFSVLFGDTTAQLGRTFRHSYMRPEVVKARLGGHLSLVARDGSEVVIAEFVDVAGSWAVKTQDPALVLIATDYVRHDIMFDVLMPEIGVDRLNQIWQSDPDLVHVLTGRRSPGNRDAEHGYVPTPPALNDDRGVSPRDSAAETDQ